MVDYAKRILEGGTTSPPGQTDYASRILNPGLSLPPSAGIPGNVPTERPEVTLPSGDLSFGSMVKTDMVIDSTAKRQHIAAGMGIEPQDVFMDPKSGEWMYRQGDQVGYVYDDHPLSRMKEFGAATAAELPAMTGGAIGAVGGFGVAGPPGAIIGGAVGTGVGTSGRIVAADQFLGDQSSGADRNKLIATDMILGLLGDSLGAGIGKLLKMRAGKKTLKNLRFMPDDLEPFDKARADMVRQLAKEHNIDLKDFQINDKATLENLWVYMSMHPSTANRVRQLKNQLDLQVEDAWDNFVGSISEITPASSAGRQLAGVASDRLNALKRYRSKEAGKLYQEAWAEMPKVDITNEMAQMKALIDNIPPKHKAAKKTAQDVYNLYLDEFEVMDKETGEMVTKLLPMRDPMRINRAKKATDKYLKNWQSENIASTDREMMQEILEIKNTILDSVDRQFMQAPESTRGKYKEARELYQALTAPIDRFKELPTGDLTRLKNDKQYMTATHKLFAAKNVDERMVRLMKKSLPEDEWQMALGSYLRDVWDNAMQETQNATVVNKAGKIRKAIFGDQKKRRIMREAMGEEMYNRFEGLLLVLQRAAKGFGAQSATASYLQTEKMLIDKVGAHAPVRRAVANLMQPAEYIKEALDQIDQQLLSARLPLLLEAMADPKAGQILEMAAQLSTKQTSLPQAVGLVNAFLATTSAGVYSRQSDRP
jgi:hypothetical protein